MVVTALLLQPGFDERRIETFQTLLKGEPAQPLLGGKLAQPILFHHAIEKRLQVLGIAQDVFHKVPHRVAFELFNGVCHGGLQATGGGQLVTQEDANAAARVAMA